MHFDTLFPFSVATKKMLARVMMALCFFLGVGCTGYGVWLYVGATQAYGAGEVEVVVCDPEDTNGTAGSLLKPEKIVVAVTGAVASPGMYEMLPGSRVGDLVATAGAFTREVDTLYVETVLNLAREMQDGEGVYIPPKGDVEVLSACTQLSTVLQAARAPVAANTSSASSTNSQLISINAGTLAELDSLPGIGAARAEAIIAGRPYATLSELVERKILSESVFGGLESLIQL